MGYIEQIESNKVTFDWAVPQPWLDDIIERAKRRVSSKIEYGLYFVWTYSNRNAWGYPAPRCELGRAILEGLEEWYYDPYTNEVVTFEVS